MFNINIHREGSLMDGAYYAATVTVAGGVPNQLVDIADALDTAGRATSIGPARYITITTDVAITVRFNDVTLGAVPIAIGGVLTIPLNVLAISRLYLTHTGVCGAGAASVRILAA